MQLDSAPEVTVIMVSYNTRDLTVRALETLLANAGDVRMDVIVWDNASADGSAEAIAERFPSLRLVRSDKNLGFGMPHNILAEEIDTEWMLLLNSDTETHPGAVENLLAFARSHPEASIFGGRTVFPDGRLNPTSCWNRMTLWSLFAEAVGLTRAFRQSRFFNPEGIGGWQRDCVREVDLVTGCLFLLRTSLWHELGGFDRRYFMYGEETDLCMRAAARGHRLMITPESQIMHLGGASARNAASRVIQIMRSRASLVRDHWRPALVPLGVSMLWLRVAIRRAISALLSRDDEQVALWREVWSRRREWLAGY